MGDVVELGGSDDEPSEVEGGEVTEMEDAVEDVAQSACDLWERFGSDADVSVVTEVDGALVRISVSIELV